ncbi:MAG TPA: methyltransferase domain-containing protein [Acidimicrobiales bacterium]
MPLLHRRDLYDVLACPNCKVAVVRADTELRCTQCDTTFPIIDGVPIMTPDGSVPDIVHDTELAENDSYWPWYYRLVMQSLLDDQVVVEMGSGDRSNSDPAVIRMDIRLTPYVDLVADAHALPFLPGSIDFIFSLAMMEHLRQPFLAAEEMDRALRDGGYIYGDCAWVFAYHGYPHHYFNASVQGLQQIFGSFRELKTGVAPYQMPSYALVMVLATYIRNFKPDGIYRGAEVAAMLAAPLYEELADLDKGFDEETAAMLAACTFYFGVKQTTETSSCFPAPVMEAWQSNIALQKRFPDPVNLGVVDNLLVWAREEGAARYPGIRDYLASIVPFAKHGDAEPYDRSDIRDLPLIQPVYGTVFDYPDFAPERRVSPFAPPVPAPEDAIEDAEALETTEAEEVDVDVEVDVVEVNVVDSASEPEVLEVTVVEPRRPARVTTLWRHWCDQGTAATTVKVARKLSSRLR